MGAARARLGTDWRRREKGIGERVVSASVVVTVAVPSGSRIITGAEPPRCDDGHAARQAMLRACIAPAARGLIGCVAPEVPGRWLHRDGQEGNQCD